MTQQKETQSDIILICENDKTSGLDKRALRDAGYNVRHVLSSGIEAARILAAPENGIGAGNFPVVVCTQKLGDMDGEQFCAIIRSHPLLLGLPILLILPNADEAGQLEALGCGASALLARPYTVEELSRQIKILEKSAPPMRKLAQAAEKVDTSAFDSALASYGLLLKPERQPDDYFRVGMKFLEDKRWNYAISAFQKALADAHIKAEAELGMAAAFKGKGDDTRFKAWLERAANTLVSAKRWHLARTAYARLLQHDPDAKNPFLTEAHRLIREQAYDDAADTLVQTLSVIPKGLTGGRLAQLCMIAENPEDMLQALEKGLAKDSTGSFKFLGMDIAQNIENLTRAKDERQRQLAAERKWEMTRKLKNAKTAQEQEKDHVEIRADEPSVPLLGEDQENGFADEGESWEEESETESLSKSAVRLQPLSQEEATTDIFEKKPRFNELLSVIKLTWKLARRSKKKN